MRDEQDRFVIRAVHRAAWLAVVTTAVGCSGPDFASLAQSPTDAGFAEGSLEDLAPIICTGCGDPNATAEAGDNASDGARGDAGDASASAIEASADVVLDGSSSDAFGSDTAVDAGGPGASDGSATDSVDVSITTTEGGTCDASTSMMCGGSCVDTRSDSSNCGGCGVPCMGGKTCQQSQCVCGGGTMDCGGACAACSAPPSGAVNVCSGTACTFACTGAGLTKCGGGCVDTTSDGSNCGSCGHGCQGGACSGGQCQPVVVGNFSSATELFAINASTAYAGLGNVTGGVSLVEQCPLTGCAGTGAGLVASLSFQQFGLAQPFAASPAGVFWIGQNPNDFRVGGYANGALVSYATYNGTQSTPATITADSTNVYWTLNGTSGPNVVVGCPVGGCPPAGPTTLETGSTPLLITVASGVLYWIDELNQTFALMKCPIAGCGNSPTLLATGTSSSGWLVPVADSANVYFVGHPSGSSGTLFKCSVNGCLNGPVALASISASYLALDSTNIYWMSGSSLMKCAIGGCGNIRRSSSPVIHSMPVMIPSLLSTRPVFTG
jgi:hypothetical protein